MKKPPQRDSFEIGVELASEWFALSMSDLSLEQRFDLLVELVQNAIEEDRGNRKGYVAN
jgi:hypothetical protein